MPCCTYWLSVCSSTVHGRFSASSAEIAAISSMRLLVVCGLAALELLLLVADSAGSRPSRPVRDCPSRRRRCGSMTCGPLVTRRPSRRCRSRARSRSPGGSAACGNIRADLFGRTSAPSRHVEPVDQPGQQESQRRAAREQRQGLELRGESGRAAGIARQQVAALGDVVGMVGLEAPGVEADRDVIGERIGAGEIEVDQPGKLARRGRTHCRETGRRGSRRAAGRAAMTFRDRRAPWRWCPAARAARCRRAPPPARTAAARPSTESAFLRCCGKSAPARCRRASASPTAAQCLASGRRIHMPSRKVTMAAGRPHSSPQRLAVAVLHRLRTGDARAPPGAPSARGRTARRRPPPASRRASGCNGRGWCGPGSWSSRRPRRCPCRTATRPGRSRRGTGVRSSAATSV